VIQTHEIPAKQLAVPTAFTSFDLLQVLGKVVGVGKGDWFSRLRRDFATLFARGPNRRRESQEGNGTIKAI
jgi:hypothetical protein